MQHEREIDALLSGGGTGSIIDRLMALPQDRPATERGNEWERAVSSRFETHLVRQMRALIETAGDAQRSAA